MLLSIHLSFQDLQFYVIGKINRARDVCAAVPNQNDRLVRPAGYQNLKNAIYLLLDFSVELARRAVNNV